MTKNIAIYADLGAGPDGIKHWKQHFNKVHIPCTEILASDILDGCLTTYDIFIILGGADVPYCHKLHGQGIQYIHAFIEQGGHFVGVCAGAYFAHNYVAWHNTTESIVGERELSLFHGTAKGPLKKPYIPASKQGAIGVKMTLTPDPYNIGTATVYVNGGSHMAVDKDTNVLAKFTYQNNTYPAIIQKNIGKGTATALSPHLEYDEKYLKDIIAYCSNRQHMWEYVLEHIILGEY